MSLAYIMAFENEINNIEPPGVFFFLQNYKFSVNLVIYCKFLTDFWDSSWNFETIRGSLMRPK